MASKGWQPMISKFFAPKNNSGDKVLTDSDKPNKKREFGEVDSPSSINTSPSSLKRSSSLDSTKSSPKRQRSENIFSSQGSSDSFSSSSQNGNLSGSPRQSNGNASPASRKSKLDSFKFRESTVQDGGQTSGILQDHRISGKNGSFIIPKGVKLTPLETQVVAIKEKHPDTLLFVECGYKYRFFGEDAIIAAKQLNIVAHLDHNFQTASIPTHRLHVHVRRLVAKGYKVGVVKQTETAALKAAGSNKSAPFSREIAALYTKSTLIGEDVSHVTEGENEATTASLMIVSESKATSGKQDETALAFVAIQPNTGDIVYDYFDDTSSRTVLWGHLERVLPVEIIVSEDVSEHTRKAIAAVMTRHDDCIRIENLPCSVFEHSTALQSLYQLYEEMEDKISMLNDLPPPVIGCLGAALGYLKEFKLQKVLKNAGNITRSTSSKDFMILPGSTVRNLDLVVNSSDREEKGSLFWVLNHTQTKFGTRILREWILKPLLEVDRIKERLEMVEELITSDADPINVFKELLNSKMPDLGKSLSTVFYKKCSPLEFWNTVSSLSAVHYRLSSVCATFSSVKSTSLQRLLQTIVDKLSDVHTFAENIDEASAKANVKTTLLKDWSDFEDVVKRQKDIKNIENQLKELRPYIAKTLNLPIFDYTTVSGSEYLIEVKNKDMKFVPSSWVKINSTKTCSRFRSQDTEKLHSKLQQLREQLSFDCTQAWLKILDQFSNHYQNHREAVKCMGTIDALLSLAKVAKLNQYCKPEIAENCKESLVQIEEGRHPIVEQLFSSTDSFVSNDTKLSFSGERVMLVTGPNMGGKSCYMRQVALIVLMVQMGSFVPAKFARLSIFDGIFTRMGATDEIFSGKSSLMVEMTETAEIMGQVTQRSLVILDELGRGTSTHDGVALATAALDYFLNTVKCLTIFVTHYLTLCEFADRFPTIVGNHHMSFIVNEEKDDSDNPDNIEVITFLYRLVSGHAGRSYGLNVARLADVPQNVLTKAAKMSTLLQTTTSRKRDQKILFRKIFCQQDFPSKEYLKTLSIIEK